VPEPSPPSPAAPVVLSPSAGGIAPSEAELARLGRIGTDWQRAIGDRASWQGALPVDPTLKVGVGQGEAAGRFEPVALADAAGQPVVEAEGPPAGLASRLRRVLIGPPLRSSAVVQERMRKLVALPILGSDALSSVAYGPEAMLAVLVLAGSAGLGLTFPVAAAIAVLMIAVGLSYRQTVRAYPRGGGSYIVATDNLGRGPGLVAAAGLITDYVLTVAVSTASGIAAITSAVPSLAPYALELGLVGIVALCAGNLRGVKQAGNLFAFPTYLFIAAVGLVIVVGLVDAASRGFAAEPHPPVVATEGVGLLLVLRAFSSGATAMTGIEAISDGVPAFRPPEWRNARTTLTAMVSALLFLFVGTVVLVQLEGVIPMADETVLSQLAHDTVGSGVLYWVVQISTAAVLLLAANTAFSDFPRLLFFLARDRNAPLAFLRMGDRLAFSNGILLLTAAAIALYVGFDGKTSRLIPLFAVGVFLAFTLSQSGMVVHWWRGREAGWRRSLAFNAVGAVLSAAVLLIAGLTKFTEGAWVVALLIPALVLVFSRVHRYYMGVRAAVALPDDEAAAAPRRGRIVPHRWGDGAPGDGAGGPGALAGAGSAAGERADAPDELALMTVVCLTTLDLPALRALAYAASLGQPVLAVHISPDEDDARRFAKRWAAWGDHLPLEIVSSPYRAVVAPLTRYLEALAAQRRDLTLTVVVPQQVAGRWWMQPLHDHVGRRLHRALRARPGIIVTIVPFHL